MSAAKKSRNRIYLKNSLVAHELIELTDYHHNYLIKVLRQPVGGYLRVFNAEDGEWLASIIEIRKKSLTIKIIEQLRAGSTGANNKLTLLFAPVKTPGASFYVQKATELGATHIVPIITERTMVRALNLEKLTQVAIEAAEQCERLTIPVVEATRSLIESMKLAIKGKIFFCDEAESSHNLITVLNHHTFDDDAILIGPEGGFDDTERALIKSLPNAVPVSLGPNILRAETAMITALGIYVASKKNDYF